MANKELTSHEGEWRPGTKPIRTVAKMALVIGSEVSLEQGRLPDARLLCERCVNPVDHGEGEKNDFPKQQALLNDSGMLHINLSIR
ncbi:hypothetical protein TNCV_4022171 [Trichonephila clavipes]|nr:hypothetical protein TNCV_4022171 [Trichonephila clavipes]